MKQNRKKTVPTIVNRKILKYPFSANIAYKLYQLLVGHDRY